MGAAKKIQTDNVPVNELGNKSWGTNGNNYKKYAKFVDKKT